MLTHPTLTAVVALTTILPPTPSIVEASFVAEVPKTATDTHITKENTENDKMMMDGHEFLRHVTKSLRSSPFSERGEGGEVKKKEKTNKGSQTAGANNRMVEVMSRRRQGENNNNNNNDNKMMSCELAKKLVTNTCEDFMTTLEDVGKKFGADGSATEEKRRQNNNDNNSDDEKKDNEEEQRDQEGFEDPEFIELMPKPDGDFCQDYKKKGGKSKKKLEKCLKAFQRVRSSGGVAECDDEADQVVVPFLAEHAPGIIHQAQRMCEYESNDELTTCTSAEWYEESEKLMTGKCGLWIQMADLGREGGDDDDHRGDDGGNDDDEGPQPMKESRRQNNNNDGENSGDGDAVTAAQLTEGCSAASDCEGVFKNFAKGKFGNCVPKSDLRFVQAMQKTLCKKPKDADDDAAVCAETLLPLFQWDQLYDEEGKSKTEGGKDWDNALWCEKEGAFGHCMKSFVKGLDGAVKYGMSKSEPGERLRAEELNRYANELRAAKKMHCMKAGGKLCSTIFDDEGKSTAHQDYHTITDHTSTLADVKTAVDRFCGSKATRQCFSKRYQYHTSLETQHWKEWYRGCVAKQTKGKSCVTNVCLSQLEAALLRSSRESERARSICLTNGGGDDEDGEKENCYYLSREHIFDHERSPCARSIWGGGGTETVCDKCTNHNEDAGGTTGESTTPESEGIRHRVPVDGMDSAGCRFDRFATDSDDAADSDAMMGAHVYDENMTCVPQACTRPPEFNTCNNGQCNAWAVAVSNRLGCCKHHIHRMYNNIVPIPASGVPEVEIVSDADTGAMTTFTPGGDATVEDDKDPRADIGLSVVPGEAHVPWGSHLMNALTNCQGIADDEMFRKKATEKCRPVKNPQRRRMKLVMLWAEAQKSKAKLEAAIIEDMVALLGVPVEGNLTEDTETILTVADDSSSRRRQATKQSGTQFEMVIAGLSQEEADEAAADFDQAENDGSLSLDSFDARVMEDCPTCYEGVEEVARIAEADMNAEEINVTEVLDSSSSSGGGSSNSAGSGSSTGGVSAATRTVSSGLQMFLVGSLVSILLTVV